MRKKNLKFRAEIHFAECVHGIIEQKQNEANIAMPNTD